MTSRRQASLGLRMVTGSTRRADVLQRIAAAATWLAGPRLLRGPRLSWPVPVPPSTWDALSEAWERCAGQFDAVVGYEQPQPDRTGMALLLLRKGRPAAFVKLRRHDRPLRREHEVLTQLHRSPVPAFHAPYPLGFGRSGQWSWLALAPVGRTSGARRVALPEVLESIASAVAPVLPRPPNLPSHWQPAHGDLVPWNLRSSRRRLWLFDWEDACWAPPGYDEVYFRAVRQVVLGRAEEWPLDAAEAVHAWQQVVARRSSEDPDAAFNQALARVLSRAR